MSPPASRFTFRGSRFAPYLILALAALLRLGWPAITEFKADEARLYALALDLAGFDSLPLRGIGSSVGLPNFPMSVWLYAIPLFVWKHPYAATLFVAALDTLAVYLCYRLTQHYWGEIAALVASLFFAVSPWAVIYSRKIWAQDLLPLFVLGYVGSALAAFVDRKRWFLLLHFIALAIVMQIHLSGLALVPLTGLWLIIFRRRVRWIEVALGVMAAMMTAVPFALYLASQPGGSSLNRLGDLLSRPATIDFDSVRFAWMTLTGSDIHSLAGPQAFRQFLDSAPNIDPARWLWGLLAVGGMLLAIIRRRDVDFILASWFLVPILFFIRHSMPIFPHYFIILFPAGYILAGDFVRAARDFFNAKMRSDHKEKSPRFLHFRGLMITGVVIISAAAQTSVWLTLLFFIGSHNTPDGFGTPLGMILEMVDEARAAAQAREILLVGKGDDPNLHEFPAVMEVLFREVPHRFVDGDAAAVLPKNGAVAVIAPQPLAASPWYARWGEQTSQTQLREGEGAFEIITLPSKIEVEMTHPFPAPRLLANGVELLGWESHPQWTVIWRVGYVPAAADYHFFNHVEGGQADGVGYPSRYWREADLVISFFDLRPGGKAVRVGMYEYPSVTNVPVMDVAGNPFSDAVIAEPSETP